jgi:hypothetical protein
LRPEISYGGFLINRRIGHYHIWKGAVVGAHVTDRMTVT